MNPWYLMLILAVSLLVLGLVSSLIFRLFLEQHRGYLRDRRKDGTFYKSETRWPEDLK